MNTRVAIVGGGISGLATAAWLALDHDIEDVVVLESASRGGGKVHTEHAEGHCLEWGPQGFLDNAPDTLELASLAGLGSHLVQADHGSSARFIMRDGVLRAVPLSPPAFLASDVLPLTGRLRVLGEPFARRRPAGDESVFDFARRRIGTQAATILVDAMVTGVFAGDPRQLSLAATFPRMSAMETEHGSLVRAMIAKVREARRQGRRSGGPAGPGGTLTTFRDGMGQLSRRLAERLGDRLLTDAVVEAVGRHRDGFVIHGGGGAVTAAGLLLAVPAPQAATILAPHAPAAVAPLNGIANAPIAVVMTSYADGRAFAKPPNGFGFLVPGVERAGILGSLFCHAIFPDQAPDGRLLLRTMLGGARDPGVLDLGDDALLQRSRQGLARALGRDPEPDRVWIIRHPEGIAQYTLGHLDRVTAAEDAAAGLGIELTGSSYRGVSVNDCIRQARAAATRLAKGAARTN